MARSPLTPWNPLPRYCLESRKVYNSHRKLRSQLKSLRIPLLTLMLTLWSCCGEAQLPPYKTTDFRTVTNTSNGVVSIPLCGSDGRGIFFNSSDQQAGSCIDGSAFQPAWLLSGSQLYVPLGSALTALRETSCYTAAYQGGCTSYGLQKCGTAKLWQVFHVPDMAYIGQSDTAGGPPTPVQKVSIVCPTPTPAATRTATVTPKPVSPVSTPTRPSSLTPTASQSPSCATPTPTPTPTPIPCGVVR